MKIFKNANWLTLAFATVLLLAFTSCDKDDNTSNEEATITEEEAVDIIESALVASTEGIGQEIEDAVYLAEEYSENFESGEIEERDNICETVYDSTVVRNINNPNLTLNYNLSWEWSFQCNDLQIPVAMDYTTSTGGDFETARLISTNTSTSEWTLENLFTGTFYLLNGTYNRTGSTESKIGNQNSFSTNLNITVDGLSVNKGDHQIQSGIASLTLTATGPNGSDTTIEADIVFNGGGSVTIIINGNSYNIELY